MTTIALRVEAAMRASEYYYQWFKTFALEYKRNNDSVSKRWSLRCRTLAVVKHDRYLNGRR